MSAALYRHCYWTGSVCGGWHARLDARCMKPTHAAVTSGGTQLLTASVAVLYVDLFSSCPNITSRFVERQSLMQLCPVIQGSAVCWWDSAHVSGAAYPRRWCSSVASEAALLHRKQVPGKSEVAILGQKCGCPHACTSNAIIKACNHAPRCMKRCSGGRTHAGADGLGFP